MAFEKFTKPKSRIGTPKASIWTKGQIGLNQGAIHHYQLNDYKYAVLFYDKDTRRVGIKFTNEEEDGIIKIIRRPQGGLSISGTAFLNYYKVDHSETGQFDLTYDEKSELHVFQL